MGCYGNNNIQPFILEYSKLVSKLVNSDRSKVLFKRNTRLKHDQIGKSCFTFG